MGKLKVIISSLAVLLVVGLVGAADANLSVEEVAPFDPQALELPEGIAVDKRGIIHVGMLLTGEVRKLDSSGNPLGSVTIPGFEPPSVDPGTGEPRTGDFLVGLAVDAPGNVYAVVTSPLHHDPERGEEFNSIWRVTPEGEAELVASLPDSQFLNDLAFDKRGNLYVTDSGKGAVWVIDRKGAVSQWLQHDLLEGDPGSDFGFPVGANGLAFDRSGRNLYLAVSDFGRIVRVPVAPDGSAGTPEVFEEHEDLEGADGIAFDNRSNLYAAVNRQDQIAKVTPEGDVSVVAHGDPLDFPATIAFGTGRSERSTLFIANFAFARFAADDPTDPPKPGVLKLDVGIPGRPLP